MVWEKKFKEHFCEYDPELLGLVPYSNGTRGPWCCYTILKLCSRSMGAWPPIHRQVLLETGHTADAGDTGRTHRRRRCQSVWRAAGAEKMEGRAQSASGRGLRGTRRVPGCYSALKPVCAFAGNASAKHVVGSRRVPRDTTRRHPHSTQTDVRCPERALTYGLTLPLASKPNYSKKDGTLKTSALSDTRQPQHQPRQSLLQAVRPRSFVVCMI